MTKRYCGALLLGATFITHHIYANTIEEHLLHQDKPHVESVMTPARLKQNIKNVPAAVTVITSSRIRKLGISTLPEAMRLIPGMRITQASGWDYRINFHGTNALIPRRMLLLVNGMAVHRYGFAEIDWSILALDIEDIERIEATRSPSSASYGSNAFQVVVNIVTKHPQDVDKIVAKLESGSNGAYKYFGRLAGNIGATSYYLSLGRQGDNGFDFVTFDEDKAPAPTAVDDHDLDRLLFRSNTKISPNTSVELQLGGINARVEDEEVDPNQLAPPDRRHQDRHAQVVLNTMIGENHSIKLQASYRNDSFKETWNACNPAILFLTELRDLSDVNTALAQQLLNGVLPTGSTDEETRLINAAFTRIQSFGEGELSAPICGSGNQDHETRKRVIEIEDTFAFNGKVRMNTGIGYQDNDLNSETYSNGLVGSYHKYLFANLEYLPTHWLTINSGFMYESVSTVDNSAVAPRLGFNFHLNSSHTLRLAYSTGKRMPNILETDREWSYLVRNWNRTFDGRTEGRFFLTTRSPEGLRPESIKSYEIGLLGNIANTLKYDMRIFKEDLTDLISEKGRFFDYNLTNNNNADMHGFEAEVNYKLSSFLELDVGYSYLDADTSNIFEDSLHADHQGFGSLVYKSQLTDIALAHYSNSPITGESYDRTDLVFSNTVALMNDTLFTWRVTGSYFWHDKVAYRFQVNNRALSRYDRDFAVKAEIGISY